MEEREYITKQVNFIRLGALTKRYHTKSTIRENTVGHHSFGVAMLCWLLLDECPGELIMAGLCHDLAEQVTGDVSSPTKRKYPQLAEMVQQMEYELLGEHDMDFEIHLSPEHARILKMADRMDGMLFCINEYELGNHSILDVYNRYVNYIEELTPTGRERLVFNAIRAIMVRYVERQS